MDLIVTNTINSEFHINNKINYYNIYQDLPWVYNGSMDWTL